MRLSRYDQLETPLKAWVFGQHIFNVKTLEKRRRFKHLMFF